MWAGKSFLLKFPHIRRLRSLLALGNVKTHAGSLCERFKSLTLDFGMMYEHIRSILLLNKTKSL